MISWLDKYKPNKINDVIGDKEQIKKMVDFLKQFTNVTDFDDIMPNIIISGPNGIGKTLIVDLALQEADIRKCTENLLNITILRKSKNKNIESGFNKNIKTFYTSISNYKFDISGELNSKISALVFDDVSSITNIKEKEVIKTLVKLNNKFKKIPIIIIANKKYNKTINEVRKLLSYNIKMDHLKNNKKVVNEIILKVPEYKQLIGLVKKISANENIKFDKSSDIYDEIIEHSQSDIRRLIDILSELKMLFKNKTITYQDFLTFKETSKIKDIEPSIYEATKIILNKYDNVDNILNIYSEERATIPLMIHENYLSNIQYQYPKISLENKLNMMYNISKSISESDKIDGIIYSNQYWNLQSVHGFYACVMPSYYINQYPNKLSKDENFKYTQDYNKTSIKKINNKVIKKAQENKLLKNVSIYDFLYMASILKDIFESKEWDKLVDIIKPYNFTLKELESIIKIDKIDKCKNILSGKQKNILKEMMHVSE